MRSPLSLDAQRRAAPTSSWPSAMPPSFGGTRRWVQHGEALGRASRCMAGRAAARSGTHRRTGRRCRGLPRVPASAQVDDQRRRPRGGTARRPAPARTPARSVGRDHRREHRGRVDRRTWLARRPTSKRVRRCRAASTPRGQGPRVRSRPAPRRRPPGARPRARTPRRTAGPCWTSARSRSPVSSWCAQHASARRPGRPRTGGRSRSQAMPAAHRWASAIRYGPQHARRRRRRSGTYSRWATRR